jgi:DnaJ-class molecular chaperone
MVQKENDYQRRKRERTEYYLKYGHKNKLVTCPSCSGFKSYKNGKCGMCNGTGKVRERMI